jgi:hypothetical protein
MEWPGASFCGANLPAALASGPSGRPHRAASERPGPSRSRATRVTGLSLSNTSRTAPAPNECFPCSRASLQGWSIPFGVMDECAFFRLESSIDSDGEIETAIRRGVHALPSAKLLAISVPYVKAGILYDAFRNHWGTPNPDILVWQAPTSLMVPSDGRARSNAVDPLAARTVAHSSARRALGVTRTAVSSDATSIAISSARLGSAARGAQLERPRLRLYRVGDMQGAAPISLRLIVRETKKGL